MELEHVCLEREKLQERVDGQVTFKEEKRKVQDNRVQQENDRRS
jgi:hypothetical protein